MPGLISWATIGWPLVRATIVAFGVRVRRVPVLIARHSNPAFLIVPSLVLLAAAVAHAAPAIRVTPAEVLEGEPISVTITGLKPGQGAVLHACRMWDRYPTGTEPYHSRTTFLADSNGVIDLATAPPQNGARQDAPDPSRPFWSMVRVDGPPTAAPASCHANLQPGMVRLVVEADGEILASGAARLWNSAPGVTVTEVRDKDVVGVFAVSDRAERRPGVIVLGGSEGGLFTARALAPLLASHGFAALGVGYFSGAEQGLALPANLESIPIEVVERARRWLSGRSSVDASRIAIVGVSKGAELALLAAATYDWVSAVAAFAPSHVVWEGVPSANRPAGPAGSSWTIAGRAVPFVRWSYAAEARGREARTATGQSRLTEVHLESLAEFAGDVESATIRIERAQSALLLVAGIDDGMWPAAYAVDHITARLTRERYKHPVKIVRLSTGHQVLGTGWAPTTTFNRNTGRLQGGSAQLDARAQAEVWPQLLEFLRAHLR